MRSQTILTRAAIDHILKVYATEGSEAARALAPRYNIEPSYVKQLAFNHGVKVKFKHPKKPRGPDPRWQWAIKRGAVKA